MTLDGLTLHVVTNELNEKLANSKIQKVLMPTKEEIVLLTYSAAEGSVRLVISADAGDCAVYITEHTKPNPKTAPAFCMFLRKHLVGSVIRRIEQSGLDRVVTLHIEAKDELLRPRQLRLIVEIMGKYSNIILTDEAGRILDSIRRVPPDVSRMRTVLPGVLYERPPQRKLDPIDSAAGAVAAAIRSAPDTRIDRRLSEVLDGVSRQTAEEILERSRLDERLTSQLSIEDSKALAETARAFLQSAISTPLPTVQHNDASIPVFMSLVPYNGYAPEGRRQFDSANAMLDYYYSTRAERARVTQARDALDKTIGKHLQKLDRLIRIYENSLQDAERTTEDQHKADLITANLYRLKKGMTEFIAQDFETGQDVRIELDASRTPTETAQRMYRRIAKQKRAAFLNAAKLADALEEQDFLLGAQLYTENATTLREIAQIKDSLADAGYVSRSRKGQSASSDAESEPLRFTSPTGYAIYVGRNDRQNELLTNRTARKDDIWFHAQKIPGSHVILETGGKNLNDIDDATIVLAAQLAAHHSRAKRSGKTPVDYTQRRNVKKPPQSRPGKVIYDDYFTVYVDANPPDLPEAEEKLPSRD